MNVTTLEVNVITKDHHYLVVKMNSSDVYYHILFWSDHHYHQVKFTTQVVSLISEFTIITILSSESEAHYTSSELIITTSLSDRK